MKSQEKLQKLVEGFRFNMGFSGYFFQHGNSLENKGDLKILGKNTLCVALLGCITQYFVLICTAYGILVYFVSFVVFRYSHQYNISAICSFSICLYVMLPGHRYCKRENFCAFVFFGKITLTCK